MKKVEEERETPKWEPPTLTPEEEEHAGNLATIESFIASRVEILNASFHNTGDMKSEFMRCLQQNAFRVDATFWTELKNSSPKFVYSEEQDDTFEKRLNDIKSETEAILSFIWGRNTYDKAFWDNPDIILPHYVVKMQHFFVESLRRIGMLPSDELQNAATEALRTQYQSQGCALI